MSNFSNIKNRLDRDLKIYKTKSNRFQNSNPSIPTSLARLSGFRVVLRLAPTCFIELHKRRLLEFELTRNFVCPWITDMVRDTRISLYIRSKKL